MKKGIGVIVLIIIAVMMSSVDVSAQYGKKKKRRDKTNESERDDKTEQVEVRTERGTPALLERFWFGVNIGNPQLFGSQFGMGLGPMAAYKFNNIFSAGIITDVNYTLQYQQNGPNGNFFDLAIGGFGRARFLRAFYGHVEYNLTSLDRFRTTERRTNFSMFLVGGGYSSPTFTAWSYEATLLYDVTENLGEFRSLPIVYRLGLTYNF